ncbi:predicted protein [Nematostella vectensis]|uniref:FP protein C-terminal domain-containing protein n=1 Tax=Nematostella vectensis TaxID=45351 RepID=A7T9U9_NEMVE|nr:predicted protein [Nematostella vectensis]|eukprot:XP_001619324.1 hypothetical protein NEMVEDRAFT_v1g224296 [Nematostella vectensis]
MDETLLERVNSLEKSMDFFNNQFELIKKKVTTLERENDALRVENNVLNSRISTITDKLRDQEAILDEQEQYMRRECLEFKGIPSLEDENTNDLVIQVAQLAGVELDEDDISISHRLPAANNREWSDYEGNVHPPSPPTIIAKFVRRDIKDEIYKARFSLKDKTTQELEDFTCMDHRNHIYIAESLTQARKKLFKACLKAKKDLKFAYAGTVNGKVYLKKDKKSRAVYINSPTDIAKLRRSHAIQPPIADVSRSSRPIDQASS